MLVPELLLETLDDLVDKDFEKVKWYLKMEILDGCKPIPKSHLDKASREDTVTKMTDMYGEESAVNVTVKILRKMNVNAAAEKLKSKYAEERQTTSTSSSSATPAAAPAGSMTAQGRSVIFAPQVAGCNAATWNVTINK